MDLPLKTFQHNGFNGDNEFGINAFHEALETATLHIYTKNSHIQIVERSIQNIK